MEPLQVTGTNLNQDGLSNSTFSEHIIVILTSIIEGHPSFRICTIYTKPNKRDAIVWCSKTVTNVPTDIVEMNKSCGLLNCVNSVR